jgi:PAS domain S-box-containing protein
MGGPGDVVSIALAILLALAVYFAIVAQSRAGSAKRRPENELDTRRLAEHTLRAAHTRALTILDTALDAVVAMDHEGRIAEFNRGAEKIFGYRRDDVIGRLLAEVLIPESQRDQHRQGLSHYLVTGEARVLGKRLEVTALRTDGSLGADRA